MANSLAPYEVAQAATGEIPKPVPAAAGVAAPPLEESLHASTTLQDVLPEIKALATKVGGLDRLAEIIATIRPAGQE